MAQTVLAHIAAKLPQKENTATAALAFIFNKSGKARGVISAELERLLGKRVEVTRIEPQVGAGEEGRPDLAVYGRDGLLLAFIEAKFFAPLTAAQPVEYVNQLRRSGGGVLLMLAPERRLAALRAELIERFNIAGEMAETFQETGLRVPECAIDLISWNRLVAKLQDAAIDDRDLTSDVSQLSGLTAGFESEGFIPLTRVDIDDQEVPRRVLMLANLVTDIVDKAVETNLIDIQGLRPQHSLGATGRYAAFKRAGVWIGLSHWRWLEHGISPLWIAFSRNDWGRADDVRAALKSFAVLDPPRLYVSDDGVVQVPLRLRVGVDKTAVVNHVIDQLREVDDLLTVANLPLLKSSGPKADE